MEFFVAIGLSFAFALLIKFAGGQSFESVVGALAELVGGFRTDGWPHGVQEEDRDTPWGRIRRSLGANGSIEPPAPKPQLMRVQPIIRSR